MYRLNHVKYSSIFLGAYAVLLLSRILVLTSNYNWPVDPVALELVYIVLCGFLLVYKKFKMISANSLTILCILLLHTILWGKVFVNDLIASLIESLYKSQIMFVIIIAFTVFMIRRYGILYDFIKVSFWILIAMLLLQFITNISDLDLSNIVNIMSKDERTRGNFGFGHYNTLGAACVCTLVLSSIVYKYSYKFLHLIIWMARILAIVMLLCSASRSSLTSLAVFIIIYYSIGINDLKLSKNVKINIKIVRFVLVLILILIVLFEIDINELLIESQRGLVFNHALPLFLRSGRVFLGLGFASNTAYGTGATPYTTYWIDNGYIYYLITSGILGFTFIVAAISILFYGLYKRHNDNLGRYVFSLFVMYLYGSLFEVTIFMSGAIINYIYLPIFIVTISYQREWRKKIYAIEIQNN